LEYSEGDIHVRRLYLLLENTGRAAWAPRNDFIAFDRIGSDGYSDIYLTEPDGSLERCLTCDLIEFRKIHCGNPTWHPSGRLLVFQAEKPIRRGGTAVPFMEVPGRSLSSDLWAITPDGRRLWQLTNYGDSAGRAHGPRFSHEGDRLAWSERISGGGAWGRWVIQVAAFSDRRGIPKLRDKKTHKFGGGFVENYGFSTNDRAVLIARGTESGDAIEGTDLHLLNLEDSELERLTTMPGEWDRYGRLAPNGKIVAWSSSRENQQRQIRIRHQDRPPAMALDLWVMNADGRNRQRLTHFNDVFSPQYAGKAQVAESSWSPAGDRLVVHVARGAERGGGSLYMVELNRPIGR
jgi:Tol biopolymer transport system component